MHSQELLAQAQQGNPKVIAAILNHALKPRGIVAQVARRETCLYVLLGAIAVPPKAEAIALVSALLHQLDAKPIKKIAIHGQRTGDKSVAWRQEIPLHLEPLDPPTFAFDVTQTTDPSPTDPVALSTDPSPTAPVSDQPVSDAMEAEVAPVLSLETPSHVAQSLEASDAVDRLSPNPWDDPTEVVNAAQTGSLADGITPSGWVAEAIAPVPTKDLPPPRIEEVLRRPEAVVLLLFVSVLILWQAYLDLTESAWEDADIAISSQALAYRLGVSRATIYRRKNQEDFSAWTQTLDPEGIAWVYVTPKFIPALM